MNPYLSILILGALYREELVVAGGVRVGMLRNRNDVDSVAAVRYRTIWDGST